MAQPKTPPLSIRLNVETLKVIDRCAAEMNMTRHATILMALGRGLEVWGYPVITSAPEDHQWSEAEVASLRARPKAPLEINRIAPGPQAWPSGALVEPHHVEDPVPKLTLGGAVAYGYQRPKPGERAKKPKR